MQRRWLGIWLLLAFSVAVAGAGTYAFIDADAETGQLNALGDDAIKVGLIYKPDAVTPVGDTAVLNTPEFVLGGDAPPPPRFARERVLCDGGSRDDTTTIARQAGATVVSTDSEHVGGIGAFTADPSAPAKYRTTVDDNQPQVRVA